MANEIVKVTRPPLPAIGKITGLGPGSTRIRDGIAELRAGHDGLNDDLQAYNMAVGAVRDHVRGLHEDLSFEMRDAGNGAGGQVSQEQLEKRVDALVNGATEKPQLEEAAAPLPADPAAAPGSEH